MENSLVEYMTYLLIHTANSDAKFTESEAQIIKQKAPGGIYEDTQKLYSGHSMEDRETYLTEMKQKWMDSENKRIVALSKVREILIADTEIDPREEKLYSEVKKYLYS